MLHRLPARLVSAEPEGQATAATVAGMSESTALSAALRQAAASLVAAADWVGRVLVSVADALEPDSPAPPAKRRAQRKASTPRPRSTSSSRGRSPRA